MHAMNTTQQGAQAGFYLTDSQVKVTRIAESTKGNPQGQVARMHD